ncbi:hypothetical protein BBP40_003888 [Aspergillus hancockii]|nr:hypothetical protein BBP40_003888 [Aspergillus hancockii]
MTRRYLGLQGNALQIAIGVIAGMDFLLFGYDQGVTGGLLTLQSFIKYFPTIALTGPSYEELDAAGRSAQSTRQGIVVAAYNLGCFAGSIPTIWVGNWLGRRKTIFLGSFIMVIGALLQCTSYHLPQLIIGRLVTGFGNGMNTSTVPTWQSECCKSNHRGKLVMIEGAMITCGITISYWIDFGLLFTDPSEVAWRFPLAFQIFFAAIILAFVMFLPESPRWLVLKGREDEAKEVLGALLGDETDPTFVQTEFTAIKATVLEMAKGSFRDMFTMDEDRHFHRTVLAYVNQMFQQISGINLITYYIPVVLEQQMGMTLINSRLIAACNGTEYFIASWIAVFTIEKFGRRQLMLFGAAGMSISMIILAITASLDSSEANIACIVFLFVFNTFFAIGWLGMTWLYPAEIVPLKIRAPANALATSSNWIFNFMVVMITPVAFENIKYQTYIIFAVINAFIVPVVYFFYPETTRRSLEEMDRIFRKTKNIFSVVRIADTEPHMYGKKGELLLTLEDVEDDAVRRASVLEHHNKEMEKDSSEDISIPKAASPQQSSDKEHNLERIVRHFMGDISFEPSNLQFVADVLERDRPGTRNPSTLAPGSGELYSIHPLSTSTMIYSGEFSHWNFSRMIRRKLQSLGNDPDDGMTGDTHTVHDPFRATGLQSSSSIVSSARTYFPPRHIANFLLDTFLEFTQTNYYYFDETEFRQKLDYYYIEDRYLDINDAGWICTLFMTFASGTQFAYMNTNREPYSLGMPGEDHLPDDTIGLALYRFSCRLIPDLITTASVETVQAFLLFGVYTLPIDTSGLAYTYLGLAIKMAIQNGMHRRFGEGGLDPRTIELRNRLWWTAYTLDRRISVLHGRPVSISTVEIDCDMPKDLPALRPSGRATNLPNVTATIHLTEQLVKASHIISRLRNCPRELHHIYLKQLLNMHDELMSWWSTLPENVHCRDLDPSKPFFRFNVHLELTFTMVILYMGRPLILAGTPNSSDSTHGDSHSNTAVVASTTLCSACVQAGLRIIELCQLLQDSVGVARVSYTEFSSCRAALLAIIAQSLNTRTDRLREALTQGMGLIRRMCVGLPSARSEVAVIEALERAAQRLDRRTENKVLDPGETGAGYGQFRRWAMLWQSEPQPSSGGVESEPVGLESSQLPAASFDGFFSSFPQELGAFASFPEMGVQFDESMPAMLWPDDLPLPVFTPNP